MPSTAGRTPVLKIIVDVFENHPAHCRADAGLAPIRNVHRRAQIKTTSLAGGLFTAYKAAVTSLALKGPLIKI